MAEKKNQVGNDEQSYDACIELSRRCVAERQIHGAMEHARRATSIDSTRPEAFNLLGASSEARGEPLQAQKYYGTISKTKAASKRWHECCRKGSSGSGH
jgi:Flp pilus assembly protein TadD